MAEKTYNNGIGPNSTKKEHESYGLKEQIALNKRMKARGEEARKYLEKYTKSKTDV